MIRPATLRDVSAILSIGTALAADYPLRAEKDRMKQLIVSIISSPSDFALVCEEDGMIRGVLLACVSDNAWAQRKFADIQLWWSDLPGQGITLLRMFRNWVVSRNAIKIAGFVPAQDLDPRIYSMLERCGFGRAGGTYIWVR